MATLDRNVLVTLARAGARQRLLEIKQEEERILAFLDAAGPAVPGHVAPRETDATVTGQGAKKRKRVVGKTQWTPKARKAAALRAKKHWADRRRQQQAADQEPLRKQAQPQEQTPLSTDDQAAEQLVGANA